MPYKAEKYPCIYITLNARVLFNPTVLSTLI